MPAKIELTWEPATCRWKKVYKGRSYTVSCRVLGVPPTKHDSYQAANSWWQAKKAAIDSHHTPHPHAERLELLSRRLAWAHAQGEGELAQSVRGELTKLESDIAGDLLPRPIPPLAFSGAISDSSERLYEELIKFPSPTAELVARTMDDAIWDARLSRDAIAPPPKDRTAGAQVERFLALERGRVESRLLSVGEFDTIRRCLHAFRDWVGSDISIDLLDSDRWEGWWTFLMTQSISVEYKKKRLRVARAFVGWLAEKGLISLPLNLHSRRHRFGGGSRSVPTLPIDAVETLISMAPGQLRLHLLLMLNCGMTQVDIADLQPKEVDWDRGRIRRKRRASAYKCAVWAV